MDDEPKALEGLELMIDWKSLGFEICGTCMDGEEAVGKIKRFSPHIVVTDIRMPRLDGLELIHYVRKNIGSSIYFIIMSAYDEFGYAKKAMEQGVNYYLLKPILEEEMNEAVYEIYQKLEKERMIKELEKNLDREKLIHLILRLTRGNDTENKWIQQMEQNFENTKWYYLLIKVGEELRQGGNTLRKFDALDQYLKENEEIFLIARDITTGIQDYVINISQGSDKCIEDIVEKLYEKVKEVYGKEIYIVVGDSVCKFSKIKQAYESTLHTMNFSIFTEKNKIIYYKDIQEYSINYGFKQIQHIEELLEAIKDINKKQVDDVINKIEEEFCEECTSPEVVRLIIMNFIYRSIDIVKKLNENSKDMELHLDLEMILGQGVSIAEMIRCLKKYCDQLLLYVSTLRRNQAKGILYEIELYLHKNFHHSLTITEISKKYYLHPNYLGQLFSKTYGMTLTQYLHKVRVQEAKRLLKETDMALSDIAYQIGYSNYSRFIKMFERYENIKPLDYRDK